MTDPSLVRAARRAWSGLECLHVIGYFAEETRDQALAYLDEREREAQGEMT